MEVTTRWFVDAWAVYDGVAFASRSAPEIRRTPRAVEAETTVFLSVPELEPIPVGRITTAMRAARASFQDGFFDPEGTEIAFDTLEGIRQSVRRAYIASGMGPGGIAMPPRPAPDPNAPGSDGGGYFTDALGPPDSPEDEGPPLDVVRRLLEERPERVRYAVRIFAEAVLVDWERTLQRITGDTEGALAEFYLALADLGIWQSSDDRDAFAGHQHNTVGIRYFGFRRYSPGLGPGPRRYTAQQLLGIAPCSAVQQSPAFSRLSDPLKLSLCDSEYLLDGGLRKAAPLLLAAALVGPTTTGPLTFWHGADEVLDYRIRAAVDWLERQLPQPDLIPDVADRLLNAFARGWLEGPPEPTPTSTPEPTPTAPSNDDVALVAPVESRWEESEEEYRRTVEDYRNTIESEADEGIEAWGSSTYSVRRPPDEEPPTDVVSW